MGMYKRSTEYECTKVFNIITLVSIFAREVCGEKK